MLREQRLMMELADTLGDRFDDYIMTFDGYSLWDIKEKEFIVNRTFKDIVDVFANYNLTTTKDILANVYELGSGDVLPLLLNFMIESYLKHGSKSLLNRIMLFCYTLHEYTSQNNIKPTELIRTIYDEELYTIKPNLLTKIKYKLNKANYPFDVFVKDYKIVLIALISGNSFNDTMSNILMMSGAEELI